jgi:DUF4097 and DUF4098 domain-containing protein YvlB
MSRNLASALAVVLVSGFLTTACADMDGADFGRYTEQDEKHFTVTGTPDVELATFDGAIEVEPWDRHEVAVRIEKRGRDKSDVAAIDVHADQQGDHVVVEVRNTRKEGGVHFNWNNARRARLVVSVPASANISARSGDGSVRVRDVAGHMKLHTGDGSVKLEGLAGAIEVDTGDGSINASGKFTGMHVRTGDGSVTIHAAPGSTASSDWDVSTGDDSVTLELPDGFNAEVDAHTGDGHVRLQDITLSNVSGRLGEHSVRGTLGSGGKLLRVRTGDGSITLRRF